MLARHIRAIHGVYSLLAFLLIVFASLHASACDRIAHCQKADSGKRVIGATALVTEKSWGVVLPALVDTGAHTCSIDAERVDVENEAEDKKQNVGKRIRFLMRDGNAESDWIETTITGVVTIMTADEKESLRYEVRLTLERNGFEKEVQVTLNDRSDLPYPMLLGRNYLLDDFVVDVSIDEASGGGGN